MSAETILTNVLRAIGLETTSAQLGGSNFQILQIRQFMNEAGLDISRRAQWSKLFSEETVTGPTNSHPLPADFYAMAERGAVRLNKAAWSPVRPIVEPEQWAFLSVRTTAQPFYHISGGQVLFAPQVDSDGATIRYASDQWVTGKTSITANSDTLAIPERLVEKGAIWRWRREKGMPYEDQMNEAEADLLVEIKADRGA